jgi:hypothetical protein
MFFRAEFLFYKLILWQILQPGDVFLYIVPSLFQFNDRVFIWQTLTYSIFIYIKINKITSLLSHSTYLEYVTSLAILQYKYS